MSLRDRLLTRPVAEAMMSPTAIVLTGVGAAAAILVGLGPIGAVVAGVLGWAGKVATAVPKAPSRPSIRPTDLGEPWRQFVTEAVDAEQRFRRAVDRTRPGPLRERLDGIGGRVQHSVDESWAIAERAQQLTEARSAIDADRIERQLARAGDTGASAAEVEALQAQVATAQRLDLVIEDAYGKLRLLDARLDEAVARAIELSVQAADVADLESVDTQVGDVVMELEALRSALDEGASGSLAAAEATLDEGRRQRGVNG